MKALVRDRYLPQGGIDQVEDIEMPHINDDEVLVRVRAASAKPWTWDPPAIMQSIGRITGRFHKPKVHLPGLDFAGEVEAVGTDVTRFRPGAAVFGSSKRAVTEYVSATEDALAPKAPKLSFAEAATVAMPGSTALQALRKGQVTSEHHVLVVGASGGVGVLAVQLAKALGADVTGVCSTKNLDLVRSLGADHAMMARSSWSSTTSGSGGRRGFGSRWACRPRAFRRMSPPCERDQHGAIRATPDEGSPRSHGRVQGQLLPPACHRDRNAGILA